MSQAKAQTVDLSGQIVNGEGQGVEYVVVSVCSAENVVVGGCVTDSQGRFLTRVEYKDGYLMWLNHLNYEAQAIALDINHTSDLKIVLSEKSNEIEEVVVEGRKPLVEFSDGNLKYNVDQVKYSDVWDMAKLLNRLPGVTASEKEGITLSRFSAKLYIDGVEQKLHGEAALNLLRSLPASSVATVELAGVGSADLPASSGAAIRIVTKKQAVDGYYLFASGNVLVDENRKWDGNLNATYMFKKRGLMFNATASYTSTQTRGRLVDSTYYGATGEYLLSDGYSRSRSHILNVLTNLNLDLKRGNNLNINLFFYDEHIRKNQSSDTYYSRSGAEARFRSKGKGHDDLLSGTIEYSSNDTLRHSVKASYGIVYGGMGSDNDFDNEYALGTFHVRSKPEMRGYIHTAKVDYRLKPTDKLLFMLGARADMGRISDKVHYSDFSAGGVPARYSDSDFSGNENIVGLYGASRYSFNDAVSIYAGVRVEYTDYDVEENVAGESTRDSYWRAFPYLNLTFPVVGSFKGSLWFSSGMMRPNYSQLIPGERYADDYDYHKGNQALRPAKYYMVYFSGYYGSFFTMNLRYQRTDDAFGTLAYDKGNGVTEYMPANYADLDSYSGGVNCNLEFFDSRLSCSFGANVYYHELVRRKNGYQLPAGRRNSFWANSVSASLSYDFSKRLGADVYSEYYFTHRNMQTTKQGNYYVDFGVRYSPLRSDRLTLSLDFENMFDSFDQKSRSYYSDATGYNTSRYGNQLLRFTVKYNISGGENIRTRAKAVEGDIRRLSKE